MPDDNAHYQFAGLLKRQLRSLQSDSAAVAGTIARLAYGLVVMKLAATNFGLSGLAVVGQLLGFMAIQLVLANAGIIRGITVLISKGHPQSSTEIASSAGRITLWTSTTAIAIFGAVAIVGDAYISPFPGSLPMFTLVMSAPLAAKSSNAIATLVGIDESRTASKGQIYAVAIGVIGIGIGAFHDLNVFTTAIAIQPLWTYSCLQIVTRDHPHRPIVFPKILAASKASPPIVRSLLQFSAAMIFPILLLNTSRIVLRSVLTESIGVGTAGQWEAILRLQDGYLQLLGAYFVMVLLPLLAGHNRPAKAALETVRTLLLYSVPVLVAMLVAGRQVMTLVYSSAAGTLWLVATAAVAGEVARVPFLVRQYLWLSSGRVRGFVLADGAWLALYCTARGVASVVRSLDTGIVLSALVSGGFGAAAGVSLWRARGGDDPAGGAHDPV